MDAVRHAATDLGQVDVHGLDIDVRQHDGRADAALRADGTEQMDRVAAMVAQRTRARAARRPHAGQRALLANTGFVHEPDLDRFARRRRRQACCHKTGELPLTKRRCGPTKIRIGCRSCMPCAWCAASCRCLRLFPPQHRLALHEEVLDEILEERVASSRGRQVPRGVKRKMSGYPLRQRTPQPTTWIDVAAAIRLAK